MGPREVQDFLKNACPVQITGTIRHKRGRIERVSGMAIECQSMLVGPAVMLDVISKGVVNETSSSNTRCVSCCSNAVTREPVAVAVSCKVTLP